MRTELFKRLIAIICFFSFFVTDHLGSAVYHKLTRSFPSYRLIDLGPTDIPIQYLSRHCWPMSLGPRLNQKGHVIWNTYSGGFFWDGCNEKRGFTYRGLPGYFHDINNKGLVLASISFPQGNKEWFLWPSNFFSSKESIAPLPMHRDSLHQLTFRSLNDHNTLVGAYRSGNNWRSAFWTPKKFLQDLELGKLFDVNKENFLVGTEMCDPEKKPFLWHVRGGWSAFSDDLKMWRPKECLKFRDFVVAPDNTVFGSFIGKKDESPYLWGYFWSPCERVFHCFDLYEMRVSCVNSSHTIVGNYGGDAAISVNLMPPIPLIDLINSWTGDIRLLEATDINDVGQIVGYGCWDDQVHIFFLDPIR
jgi:hypothetical protein